MNNKQAESTFEFPALCFSDGVECGLIDIKEETRKKAGRAWSKLGAQVRDSSASYRFVNYLDGLGLLPDHRVDDGRGWRKFSYVDMVYLELVLALRRAKVRSDVIKSLYQMFSVPYSDGNVSYGGTLWLDLLLTVHYGIEVELLISLGDRKVVFCDPVTMILLGTVATDGQIRVSLSKIVNNVRERYGFMAIERKCHFGQSNLSDGEFEAVFAIGNLKGNEEEVRIHKTTSNRVLVDVAKVNENEALRKDLEAVIRKYGMSDFTDLLLSIRKGDIAYVKKTESKIFDN